MSRALSRARTGRRLSWILIAYLCVTVAMAWRLLGVQVASAPAYREMAARQTQRQIELPAQRGRIYDRTGEPLAMSLSAATVYAHPGALREGGVDPASVAAQLAPVLDRPARAISKLLASEASFVYLARQVPRAVGRRVTELKLPGVGVLTEPRRVYPAGSLAAQIVGFAGVDSQGLSGIELSYDDVLSGTPGRVELERAPGGLTISGAPREVLPPTAGTDVVLTIDREIQYVAERVLTDAIRSYRAIGGSAIVLDVATGEVLAMASVPNFDPARISQAGAYARRNRAVTDVFEPGSVNKAITAAAALEEGLVTPDDVFVVPDTYQVGDKRFSDSSPHRTKRMTFADIIAQSSNVGTIKVAQRLGDKALYSYLLKFGYGRETGLGFPGESAGLLSAPSAWYQTSLPTIAIGQGVAATLLQVAQVSVSIASGGEWMEPTLVRGTVAADGRLDPAPATERRRVVSAPTAATMSDLLVRAVEEGTGGRAAVPGYRVGGKTGTAQKPSSAGGYEPGAYVATFAGFAPAEDPALVVAVMLDEPHPFYGGQSAAPVFSRIMNFALGHRRVPPSNPQERFSTQPAGG